VGNNKGLDYYRSLPYERVWKESLQGNEVYYVVHLVDIPRLAGGGKTRAQALSILRDAFDDYVEWRLEENLPIPAPGGRAQRAPSAPSSPSQEIRFEPIQSQEAGWSREDSYDQGREVETHTGESEESKSLQARFQASPVPA